MSGYANHPALRLAQGSLESLFETKTVNDLAYGSVSVSAPGISEMHTAEVTRRPLVAIGYWPRGIIPFRDLNFLTFGTADFMMESAEVKTASDDLIKDVVTKGKVGDVAMRQYQESGEQDMCNGFARVLGSRHVERLAQRCEEHNAPFSLLALSEVAAPEAVGLGATLFFVRGAPLDIALGRFQELTFLEQAEHN